MRSISVMALLLLAAACLCSCTESDSGPDKNFYVGAASAELPVPDFESWNDNDDDSIYDHDTDSYNDYGVDQVPSEEEPGYDPATLIDPNGDDYDTIVNFSGTENNDNFEYLAMAGGPSCRLEQPDGCRLAQGVHDTPGVQAAYFGWRSQRLLVVNLDLIGLTHFQANPLRREIETRTGIPLGRIIVTGTGNHQGPDSHGWWAGVNKPRWYEDMRQIAADTAVQAVRKKTKVRLKTVSVDLPACIDRSGGQPKVGSDCVFPVFDNGEYLRPVTGSVYDIPAVIADMRDPILPQNKMKVLQAVAKGSNRTILTLVNYSARPVSAGSSNVFISADYPAYLRFYLQQQLGGQAILLVGGQGGAPSPEYAMVPYRDSEGRPTNTGGLVYEYDNEGTTADDETSSASPILGSLPLPADFIVRPSFAKARSLGFYLAQQAISALEEQPQYATPATMSVTVEDHDIVLTYDPMIKFYKSFNRGADYDSQDGFVNLSYCMVNDMGCIRTQLVTAFIADTVWLTAPGMIQSDLVSGRSTSVAAYSELFSRDEPCVYGRGSYRNKRFEELPSLKNYFGGQSAKRVYEIFTLDNANVMMGYVLNLHDYNSDTCHPNYDEERILPSSEWGDAIFNHLAAMLKTPIVFNPDVPYYPWQSQIFDNGYEQPAY